MESGDKIRFFFEADALDAEGRLVVDKKRSLNKIGHALHWLEPAFKRVTFSQKVKDVARDVGFVEPAIAQSMYIFKQPGIGGEGIQQDYLFMFDYHHTRLMIKAEKIAESLTHRPFSH